MKLFAFHYHFLTGGVTTAVCEALRSFREHLPELSALHLVGATAARGLPEELAREGIAFEALPEIDYRDTRGLPRRRVSIEARRLASRLLERYGGADSVWWIHNHHLGKNPVFTQALLEVQRVSPTQKLILQIHDFPECGRLENLRILDAALSLPPYPVGTNVRYAVLTSRDGEVLREGGIPAASVFVLGNPVPPLDRPAAYSFPTGRSAVRRRLQRAFGGMFPGFDPARPLALYPVRTIRRKNVLEACLLALLAEEPIALAVTLPGLSPAEKGYSDRVEALFRSGRCPGLWGFGGRLREAGLSFEGLVGAADLVVSSAVQEGFGYLFIDTLQWRRPLLARNLENLQETRELFDPYPAHWYDALLCPLPAAQRRELLGAYRRKIAELGEAIPAGELPRLHEELERLFASELTDFSFLPADRQERVLARLDDPGVLEALREANRALVGSLGELLSAAVPDRGPQVQARYGPARYAQAFGRLLHSFEGPWDGEAEIDPAAVQTRIIARFARLENLRLLYD